MAPLPETLGVVGAGTMGAGIAQLGCAAGFETLLYDPDENAIWAGIGRIDGGLDKLVEKGRLTEAEREAAEGRVSGVGGIEALDECDLVIEAAPERLELKRDLFEQLANACRDDTVLATNTSSIPVTALAGAVEVPERVVGMHFFNPAPVMKLLEVIAAEQTSERALSIARATGEAMGKRVILASDGPGFLVNRCGRPFYTEALRLLQERVATHDAIDRIYRLGGGFRMGPFELMDLVGIDVGFEVAKSFTELSFGEPRWKPNPIQARMAAAGRHGRKTGRGYYDYSKEPYRPEHPSPPDPGGGGGRVVAIDGVGALARELRERAAVAGFDVREPDALGRDDPELVIDAALPATASDLGIGPEGPPLAVVCADRSLAARGAPWACGFHLLPPLEGAGLVELARAPATPSLTCELAEVFFSSLGLLTEWVDDAPGLVLGRVVCQLVNEAAFAIGEGVGSADDVDAGITLGLNHPRGPVAWGEAIGLDAVLATIDGLWEERREERYRAAPLLRRAVAQGTSLADDDLLNT